MNDFTTELCVVGTALVSPLGTTPAMHSFFDAAGVPKAAAFACPWIPNDATLGSRMGVLAAQALVDMLSALPEFASPKACSVELSLIAPPIGTGVTEEDIWLVERSVRTVLSGGKVTLLPTVQSTSGFAGEIFRAAADLAKNTVRLLVAVDSLVTQNRLALGATGFDSPWDAPPPQRSEAAVGLALATATTATDHKLPLLGRFRGGVVRHDKSTPENDLPSDGSALSEAFAMLPGRSKIAVVVGPQGNSGFFRSELELSVTRNAERFLTNYVPLCPSAVLGEVGGSALGAGVVLAVAKLRHRIGRLADENGPAVVWDLLSDGRRVALLLEASLNPAPNHVALQRLGPASEESAKLRPESSVLGDYLGEVAEGCLERITNLNRLRLEANWKEVPKLERRILANMDALVETKPTAEVLVSVAAQKNGLYGLASAPFALCALELDTNSALLMFAEALSEIDIEDGTTLPSLSALWLVAEGVFSWAGALAERDSAEMHKALLGWLDKGTAPLAAIAIVTFGLLRRLPERALRDRMTRREPLCLAALAHVSPFGPLNSDMPRDVVLPLLELPSPFAWEGVRALTLLGDTSPLDRIRAEEALLEPLGEKALWLLALAGEERDIPLFARLCRRISMTDSGFLAAGLFGYVGRAGVEAGVISPNGEHLGVLGLLLDAHKDEALRAGAEAGLATMLGPLPPDLNESWVTAAVQRGAARAVPPRERHEGLIAARLATEEGEQRAIRLRYGGRWSTKRLTPEDHLFLSDERFQFHVDERIWHEKRAVFPGPPTFGMPRETVLKTFQNEWRGP